MEDDKPKAIRLQRRTVERRRDDVVRECRVMMAGDARKARADVLDALRDLDEAERRLAELEGGQTELPLDATPPEAP